VGVGARVPSGTVTFLFSDVEGSTRLWEAHGEEMRSALVVHDEIVRGALESAGGLVFLPAETALGRRSRGLARRWRRRWPPSAACPALGGLRRYP
jgi:class 3 adenylate cyclase